MDVFAEDAVELYAVASFWFALVALITVLPKEPFFAVVSIVFAELTITTHLVMLDATQRSVDLVAFATLAYLNVTALCNPDGQVTNVTAGIAFCIGLLHCNNSATASLAKTANLVQCWHTFCSIVAMAAALLSVRIWQVPVVKRRYTISQC